MVQRRCTLLLGVIAVVFLTAAHAQAGKAAPVRFSLTLTPTRLSVPASGSATTQVVTVINRAAAVHVTAARYDFTQAPDGGIRFSPAGPLSAASWLTVTPAVFNLAPGAQQRVRIRIAVPADAEHGEHQIGLVFSVPAADGEAAGNIKINRGVGVQLLISVPGPVLRRTTLTRLTTPRFVDAHSARITATIVNSGNVHRDFTGASQLVAHVYGRSARFPNFTVLRGSTRIVSVQAQHLPLACLCRVSVTADDGTGHPTALTRRILVFPLRMTIGLLLLSLAVGLLVRGRRDRSRRLTRERDERTRRAAYQQARQELDSYQNTAASSD